MKFGGRILYSKTAIDVEQAGNHLLHTITNSKSKKTQFVLGFDIEWQPTFTNALFVSALMFSGKLLIFQREFSKKLSHFPVFGNNLENELENVF